MAIIIENFKIKTYKGINHLNLSHLNHMNIIVGDNNCGKTSLLESINICSQPQNFYHFVKSVSGKTFNSIVRSTNYDELLNAFSRNESNDKKFIEFELLASGKQCNINLSGETSTVMVDTTVAERIKTLNRNRHEIGTEIELFKGELGFSSEESEFKKTIELYCGERLSFSMRDGGNLYKSNMLYSYSHLTSLNLNYIIKNQEYKNIVIEILKLFDKDIQDIIYMSDDRGSRPIECIKHNKIGIMPISTFGDGIKKVVDLSIGIAMANNGILLIDEIETAIHAKYFEDIFNLLILSCKKFNIQMFITTHSLEVIDAMLATQNYSESNSRGDINIITLKKDSENNATFARILAGSEVKANRDAFGFEVR